jgi:hypothetical protein
MGAQDEATLQRYRPAPAGLAYAFITAATQQTSRAAVMQVTMASTAGKALQAVKQFTTTGNASRVSVTKEITIGLTLGIGAGLMWKV